MQTPIELLTDRLLLRTLDEAFAERVLAYQLRNRAFLQEWTPITGDEFYTLPAQAERLARDEELRRKGLVVRLYLFKRADAELSTVIGDLALSNVVRGAFQSCHLGYKVDGAELNQGYITEAIRRAVAYAFGELKLHRVEANVMPKNLRSRRVLQKLGFAEEGLARQYLKINGAWEDHIHYVVLNDAV